MIKEKTFPQINRCKAASYFAIFAQSNRLWREYCRIERRSFRTQSSSLEQYTMHLCHIPRFSIEQLFSTNIFALRRCKGTPETQKTLVLEHKSIIEANPFNELINLLFQSWADLKNKRVFIPQNKRNSILKCSYHWKSQSIYIPIDGTLPSVMGWYS